ncbi:MAG: polysaccharide biosynthesis tyrosine autokinase [Rhodobacteraceae bacterium]|nr:polysaccharide biosynthesis tyrosine autokinase [Paracoccaceae bacterium]
MRQAPDGQKASTVQYSPIRPESDSDTPRQMTLHGLFMTLMRGKWTILGISITAVVLTTLYCTFLAEPRYTARATVMLETREERIVSLDSVMSGLSGEATVVNSEAQVLRSRSLIGRVVRQLNLTEDPEFNTELRQKGPVARALARVRAALRPAPPSQLTPEQAQRQSVERTIGQVLSHTTVTVLPQSVVFEISAETGDPLKSARLANAIADRYVLEQLEVKFEATEKATAWLSDRVADLRHELERKQSELKAFSAETELVNADSLDALTRQQKEIRDRIADGNATLVVFTSRRDALRQSVTDPARFNEQADDRQLSRLWARLGSAPSDPRLHEVFADRQAAILSDAAMDVERLEGQLAALRRSEQELTERIQQQSEDLVRLEQLEREAEASSLIYEYFLNRLKETSVQQGIQQADSRVLSAATAPLAPSAPRSALLMTLAGVMGVLMGAGLVVLRDRTQLTFRTRQELENATGLQVFGQIPWVRSKKRADLLHYINDAPTSAAAESLRNLRTSILMSGGAAPPQVIMCTSSLPGEGKTIQSIALAKNFASLGKRVLLIEGDIRRRTLSDCFELSSKGSILGVITGQYSLGEGVQAKVEPNLDILPGDQGNLNPADLFSSAQFPLLLAEARKHYDVILIDTPPVMMVPDARVIGSHADLILYCVQWDHTRRQTVAEGLHLLQTARLKVGGLVLSQVDSHGMRRYGYEGDYKGAEAYHAA